MHLNDQWTVIKLPQRTVPSLVSRHPNLKKKGLVKLCRKSLALQEFVQLLSDRSISNLMMSHWSIEGIAAHADYFQQVEWTQNPSLSTICIDMHKFR